METSEAKHGEQMIELKVCFWTNGIAKGKGKIAPKHAWTSGDVRIGANPSHGVMKSRKVLFNSLMEITSAIEKVIRREGIVLHAGRMKYLRAKKKR